MSPSWSDIAATKRKSTHNKIPSKWIIPSSKFPDQTQRNVLAEVSKCEILTEREILITETGMADVLQYLRSGKWTAREVTEAICKRAAIAHQLTNCLTEIFFDEGMARAKELDEYLREYGKPIGPVSTLH